MRPYEAFIKPYEGVIQALSSLMRPYEAFIKPYKGGIKALGPHEAL